MAGVYHHHQRPDTSGFESYRAAKALVSDSCTITHEPWKSYIAAIDLPPFFRQSPDAHSDLMVVSNWPMQMGSDGHREGVMGLSEETPFSRLRPMAGIWPSLRDLIVLLVPKRKSLEG